MAQNYAKVFSKEIDERLTLDSVTAPIINKNGVKLDFSGNNTVTIYGMANMARGNYQRSGSNRFGSLIEVGTTTTDYILSQDKSGTGVIDRGNLEDSMMVQEAGSVLKRFIRETVVPEMDQYRLSVSCAYAVANSQTTGSSTALTSSNVYQKLLAAKKFLTNKLVPMKGRYLYVVPDTSNLLLQDSNFIKASDSAQKMTVEGYIGRAAGFDVIEVPDTYLPANTGFLAIWDQVLISTQKLKTYRILDQVQGIDGWVPEERDYYDTFVFGHKGDGLCVHMNA